MSKKIFSLIAIFTLLLSTILSFQSQAQFTFLPNLSCILQGKQSITTRYSKNPESYNDFTFTVKEKFCFNFFATKLEKLSSSLNKVMRSSNGIINSGSGNFTPIKLDIVTPSNCPIAPTLSSNFNKDFKIKIESVGKSQRIGVKFCRTLSSSGIGDDARVKSVINAITKDYYPGSQLVLLDKNQDCVGDMSGLNLCKPFPGYTI
jgi:hypothetical protein